ncbi:hypothetical protein FOFC_13050 [Fusarium oxysporum]|nr:hypothetical protein FOFC_13050 [Fusarium oxysporum]
MVEDHTRENRCLFTPGAGATWRKAYFIAAKQLGGGTQPDMVVSQMRIGKDVIETVANYKRKEGDGGWDIRNAVVRANKAAAIKGQSLGAQEIIPWSEDIGSFDAPLKGLDFQ